MNCAAKAVAEQMLRRDEALARFAGQVRLGQCLT